MGPKVKGNPLDNQKDWKEVEINGKKVDYVATIIKMVVKTAKRWRIRVKREDKIYTADVEG